MNHMHKVGCVGVLLGVVLLQSHGLAQPTFWTKISSPGLYQLRKIVPGADGFLFAVSRAGIFRSTDHGNSWDTLRAGMLSDLAVGPQGWIYTTGIPGVSFSTDNGTTWDLIGPQGINIFITSTGTILASTGSPILEQTLLDRSTDGGSNWNTVTSIMFGGFGTFAVTRSHDILVGNGWFGLLRSTNDGATWISTLDTVTSGAGLVVDSSGTIFRTTRFGVMQSTDDGYQWTPTGHTPGNVFALQINTFGYVFVAGDSGVYRTTDHGVTWTAINSGLDQLYTEYLATDSSGYLFTVTTGGLYRSVHSTTDVRREASSLPSGPLLFQNYPNPFNPSTKIGYRVQGTGDRVVTLKVYDILGREVATLVNERKAPGSYEVTFDGSRVASGVYFYRLETSNFVQTRKLVLVR